VKLDDLNFELSFEQNLKTERGSREVLNIVLKKSNEFKELFYIPPQCEKCSFYEDQDLRERIIGLKLQTPYSYLLLEGCNTDKVCEHKNVQLLYFGFSINTYVVEKFWIDLWEILTGKEVIKSEDELIKEMKKRTGFIKNSTQIEKDIVIAIPKLIDEIVQLLIEKRISCSFEYPVVGQMITIIDVDKGFKKEVRPVEEEFDLSSKELFKIRLGYFTSVAYITYDIVTCFTREKGLGNYGGSYRSNVDQIFMKHADVEDPYDLEEMKFIVLLSELIRYLKDGVQKGVEMIEEASKIFKTRVILASFYSSKSI